MSVGCVWWLIVKTDWPTFKDALLSSHPGLIFLALLAIVTYFISMSVRWRILISHKTDISQLNSLHSFTFGHMLNVFLPLRAGDLFRINYIRKLPGWNTGRAIAVAIIERLADLVILSAVTIILLQTVEMPDPLRGGLTLIVVGIAAFSFLSFLLAKFDRRVSNSLRRLGGVFVKSLGDRLEQQSHQYFDAIKVIVAARREKNTIYWKFCLLSLLGWTCHWGGIYICLMAFDMPDAAMAAVTVVVFTNFGLALPSSPGGVGVYHALVVFALALWDIPIEKSAAIALVAHAIAVTPPILLGTGSMLLVNHRSK